MLNSDNTQIIRRYINGLMHNWIACCASIAVPIALSPFVSKKWLPIIVLLEVFFLMSYIRGNRFRTRPRCMRAVYIATCALITSALIMLLFNLLQLHWLFGEEMIEYLQTYHRYNHELPYITVLIVSPVLAGAALWGTIAGRKSAFCLECRSNYSFASDDGFVGHLLRSESSYQVRSLFYLGTFFLVVDWIYFLFFFIDVNLNTPDLFMFTILPVLTLVLSVIYMARRYVGLWNTYMSYHQARGSNSNGVSLRFMVISDGEMLLYDNPETGLLDTPAEIFLANVPKVTESEARRRFESLSGIKDFNIRYVYRSSGCNEPISVSHYFVFAKKRSEVDRSPLQGEWYNAFHISNMIRHKNTAPQFSGAFKRIYTIAMAWKTYDVTGHRLYPIKNYRPTFHLNDIEDWDLNYDDARWINISCNNEDKVMFRMRDLWRKYVRSIGC